MASLPMFAWLCIIVAATAAALTVLYALAAMIRDETALHDLRVEADRVRTEFLSRLRDHEAAMDTIADVDILPEPAPASRAA